jgi:hypothetical protein
LPNVAIIALVNPANPSAITDAKDIATAAPMGTPPRLGAGSVFPVLDDPVLHGRAVRSPIGTAISSCPTQLSKRDGHRKIANRFSGRLH